MEEKKILVIEDSRDLLRVWKIFLAKLDFTCRFATGKQEALEIVRDGFQPDVLVTDYYLGDGTGDEIVREIKQLIPHVSVIFATGGRDEALKAQLEAQGHVLIKPVRFDELKQAISQSAASSGRGNA